MRVVREMPERISLSQARAWNDCHLRWAYAQAFDVPPITNVDYLAGRALHEAFAAGYVGIGNESPRDVRARAVAVLHDAWAREGVPPEQDLEHAEAIVGAEFSPLRVEATERLGVLAVEEKFITDLRHVELDTGEVFDFTVTTILDLVLGAEDGTAEIVDHKFGQVRPASGDYQLSLYGVAWDAHHPERPTSKLTLSFPNWSEHRSAVPDERLIRRVYAHLARARREIVESWPDQAWPARPGDHCVYCDHRHVCPFVTLLDCDASG